MGESTRPASDLYSLGIVAFELLTGRRPYEGDSVAAEASAHVTAEVPSVRDFNRAIPWEVDPVFAKALAKDPSARFGSAAEFVAALRAALAEAAGTTNVIAPVRRAPAPQAPSRRRRRAWLVPLVALLLAAGAGGGIAGALLAGGGKPEAVPPARPSVSVKTVTQPGTTVVTTAQQPPPSEDPATLNDRAVRPDAAGRLRSPRCLYSRAPCSSCRATRTSRPPTRTTTSA